MNTEFNIQLDWKSDQSTAARWTISHALRSKPVILIMFIGAFGNAALAAAVPLFMGVAFNAVLATPPDLGVVTGAAIGIAITQFIRGILQLGRNFGAEVIGQRLERDARAELYTSLIGKSMTFHDRQSTGDVMARATNDVREMNFMLNPGINLLIGSGMFLIMPLIVTPTIHPHLIITPLLFATSYVFAMRHFLSQLQPAADRVRHNFGTMNAVLSESIEGIETVKGAAQEETEKKRFAAGATGFRDAFVAQGDIEARFLPLLFMGITVATGLYHVLLLYRLGQVEIGDIVAYMGLLFLFGFPTFVSLFAYSHISYGLASARRILELIGAKSELDENKAGYAKPIRGAIRFENVTFRYSDSDEIPSLENVSFEIKPGQTLAIVGQTGSGKTSITKLINRIYDVEAGHVFVDDVDVRNWNMASLRQQISIIEQDLFLFSRTIAENVAFGCPDATREEIEHAAKEAQAHEFIMSFADGYDTVVGERGVTLSGGQRQRIALARAFLTDPRVLILDDSTSAIDSATEDQIQRAIMRASQDRTTILITHRLSQIRWADLILVMRRGKVATVGTHDELMQTSEPYQRIFARYD